jgi:hypothetical protein
MTPDQTYLKIVEGIYDAATDPSLWAGALEKLAAASGGKAFLTMRHLAMPSENWPTIYAGMEPDWVSAYHGHYSRRVPWIKSPVPSRPIGKATPSESVISRSNLLKTEWYNDFMRPQRLISAIGVTVVRDHERLFSAGILVPEEAEAEQAYHQALMQRVTPHFARALKVNRQLQGADFRWHAAEQYFNRINVGVLILRADLTVQFANVEAERMLGEQDGLTRDREGRLIAASSDDEVRLRRSVRSVTDPRAVIAGTDGVLRLPRRSGKRAYHMLVAGVRPPPGHFGRHQPTPIALMYD